MPWSVERGHGCPVSRPWAVVNEQSGNREGCHATRKDALKQQAALYAKEPMMQHNSAVLAFPVEWKTADGGSPGELEGYVSVFGNVDQGGDVVLPGAFKKTLNDWSKARQPLPLVADHVLSTDGIIGSVVRAGEDAYGLKVRARFSSVPKAQEIRTKMIEGHLAGMSFTYEPVDHYLGQKDGKQVRFLRELRLFEATVTPFPMNELATASAKASDKPWSQFAQADYTDEQWARACLIDTGQGEGKQRYKLPVREPSGTLNRNAVHAAAASLAGARGGVQASAEQKAKAARALVRLYGELNEDPPESLRRLAGQSSSLDFEQFTDAMRKALDIDFAPARKAAVDLLVAEYQPSTDTTEHEAAGRADGQPTADAAADTGEPAAGTAEPTAAQYALGIITPPGPRDDAPDGEPPDALAYPQQVLESLRTSTELDALEAQINEALGRGTT